MSVRLSIHPLLYHMTDDQEEVEVNGSTVGECLKDFVSRFPETEKVLFDNNGKLLAYVDIYVNGESAYPDELAKPVKDGDELHIVLIIAGG